MRHGNRRWHRETCQSDERSHREHLYADPRTPNAITSIEALNEYLGMFSANAPGWGAKVVASAETHGITRATVAFGGPGPDGETVTQLGQYFVEIDGDLICRMIGFVGVGEPE